MATIPPSIPSPAAKTRLPAVPFWLKAVLLIAVIASWLPLTIIAISRFSTSKEPRIALIQDMGRQPKYREQNASPIFADGRSDRPPVEGAVARGQLQEDDHYYRGFTKKGTVPFFFSGLPKQVRITDELLKRGQERFGIYCAACHGLDASGNGRINVRATELAEIGAVNGWVKPADLRLPAYEQRPDGHLFNTITNGIRTMPSHGADSRGRPLGDCRLHPRDPVQHARAGQGAAGGKAPGDSAMNVGDVVMAHGSDNPTASEQLMLGRRYAVIYGGAAAIGVVALAASLILAVFDPLGLRHFYFAYLTSYCFFLSLSLGGLFFVLLQHVTRAGWSVSVRRLPEMLAAAMPALAVLALPIVVAVAMQKGQLYAWAAPDNTLGKRAWLNPAVFIVRLTIYLAIWSALGISYWRKSTRQDKSGDPSLTRGMEIISAPAIVLYAITVTLAAFDLLMSLDARWYSTIFGVYFFSGAIVATFACLILMAAVGQLRGLLTRSINQEHYHDLGKFLFGFVFFWGYIAYSQYMLMWYGNIPEETSWYFRRGVSTAALLPKLTDSFRGFGIISLLLLFGHFLIPFAGLMSRKIKRRKAILAFWAAWMLIFHWLDLYWLVMPEMRGGVRLGLMELCTLFGIGGIFAAAVAWIAARHSLRPTHDPRLDESLAFENV